MLAKYLAFASLVSTTLGVDYNREFPATDPNRYIVTFRNQGAPYQREEMTQFFKDLKIADDVLEYLPLVNGAAVHVPEHLVDLLANHTSIHIMEKDRPRWVMGFPRGGSDATKLAMSQNTPWGMTRVQALNVKDGHSYPNPNLPVTCIIDSGYDLSHEDLFSDGRVTGEAPWSTDGCGHGTHVAGTVAAVDNQVGVIGVGQELPLHIVKVFGDDCSWSYASDVIGAAQECQRAGAKVISMSLGCSQFLPALCRSAAEETGFANLEQAGVLSIAAAGNAGNSWQSFPASYESVVSVAATASDDSIAPFSQQNAFVELAAPGVAVESTVPMGQGQSDSLTVKGQAFFAASMEGSSLGDTGSTTLVDCGLGTSPCQTAQGKICLISRGEVSFGEKADACVAGGGAGCIIYNNEPGDFAGTLGDDKSIMVVALSQADGLEILKMMQEDPSVGAALSSVVSNYDYYDGTSMATPHVSGVAAKIWGNVPHATGKEVREALKAGATIPGKEPGTRDNAYGYGIIDAVKSLEALQKLAQGPVA